MRVWRICKRKYARSAYSGDGARLLGGRWNPPGVRLVYASASLSLAAMEFFVHLEIAEAPDDLVSVSAALPEDVAVPRIDLNQLPANWRTLDNATVQALGAEWVRSGRSVALEVPSAILDEEWNVLLNPAHPDFPRLAIASPRSFRFDDRMFRRK